jgi:DNA-binding LacI/PurR family transcriptional regulator
MRNNPVSINDIARELGVSPSTVSRALKDHPSISRETRQRVKVIAQQQNYRPNFLAMGLRRKNTQTIGLIIPEIVHHFFSSVISGIEELAYASAYRVMICQSNDDPAREALNLNALIDHRVDGVLVSISKNTFDHDHFKRVLDQGVPVVFFDRISEELATDRVMADDYEGARAVTTHLIQQGRKRILHLATPGHLVVGKERLGGYYQALHDQGIERNNKYVLQCDTRQQVMEMSKTILELAGEIDAIFAVNDFTAIAAMQLLQENGFGIPGQISVAGFGDDPIARIVRPRLTTMEQKGFEIGRESARLLIERIENPDKTFYPRSLVFECTLKIREST